MAEKMGVTRLAVLDTKKLKESYKLFKQLMPLVKPHYAVKCNNHPDILKTLYACGCGFDCASPNEVRQAL